ncbi:hypothetical protein [Xanthomonas oryzae]|uniref:hypothetical protein n=1 Tax=Xanthomonas oryzae TaxID=347 RepID=UPI001EE8C7AF|nr:hypothetical protein [Xanthomonas oryzae]
MDSLILRASEFFEVSPAFRQHFSQFISGSSPGITCESTLRMLHAFVGSPIRALECGIIRTLVSYIDQIWEYLILNFTIALMLFFGYRPWRRRGAAGQSRKARIDV